VLSKESGIDNPKESSLKNSYFDFSYNTFGIDKYILSFSNKKIMDVACAVSYNQIYALINSNKHDSGIFNVYSVCFSCYSIKEDFSPENYVFMYEFSNSFTSLEDEYSFSSVAYEDFYPVGVEPWEPNLTTLTDIKNLKWKKLVKKYTQIPTPWNKTLYYNMPDKNEEMKKQLLKYIKNIIDMQVPFRVSDT